ncbi:MAG TPA: HEPN domain-containing protein [Methanosarcinales archaeon]|nr:HEPN domain-containing protein [Methanosarcinales archaeon]
MASEIDALLKMADKSIRGARLLFEDELYGFAVSRSYYTMFYLATAVANKRPEFFETQSCSRCLWSTFRQNEYFRP